MKNSNEIWHGDQIRCDENFCRQTETGLVAVYDIDQETERVYSFNPGARTG